MEIDNKILLSNSPAVLQELGNGSPKLVFNLATHGNEQEPLFGAISLLHNLSEVDICKGTLQFIISNPPALLHNKRFLHFDLNRSSPGEKSSLGEKRMAAEVLDLTNNSDYVIDLHTAPSPPPFVILSQRDTKRLALAEISSVKPIVLFEAPIPCAMVDFVKCGIGIEVGTHYDNQSREEAINQIYRYGIALGLFKGKINKVNHSYFEVFDSLEVDRYMAIGQPKLENFKTIEANVCKELGLEGENCYPLLVGKKDNTGNYCYLIRSINRNFLLSQ